MMKKFLIGLGVASVITYVLIRILKNRNEYTETVDSQIRAAERCPYLIERDTSANGGNKNAVYYAS